MITAAQLATLERHRRRLWGLCYRMTGSRTAADDLAQESIARAIERSPHASEGTFEGWLYRVTTTTCLDWLRRRKVEERALALVDPIDSVDEPFASGPSAESRLIRRDDIRLAIMTALQQLTPRQRAVLVLRDVLDRSTEETAAAIHTSPGHVRVLLHRARAKLQDAHRIGACDAPVDGELVERFARALELGDIDSLTALFAPDVWGLIDDGVRRRRPTRGLRAVTRQWANALARYGPAHRVRRMRLNGEPSLLVEVAAVTRPGPKGGAAAGGGVTLAAIHLETRGMRVCSIRVLLDPARLAGLGLVV